MAAFLDGCRFNSADGGTGDWTFASAVNGYQSPTAANVVNGRLYKYRAESADLSQWEFGEGAYNTASGVLARTTVLYNSSGTTAKIDFATVPQVAIVALKEDLISVEEANTFTAAQQAQARSNIGAGPAPVITQAVLAADVDIPLNSWVNVLTISPGTTGTFLVFGKASMRDTANATVMIARIFDGVNVWDDSGFLNTTGANLRAEATFMCEVTNPAGSLVLQAQSQSGTHGVVLANENANPNPVTTRLLAVRVA
jgi:hypothetical protein